MSGSEPKGFRIRNTGSDLIKNIFNTRNGKKSGSPADQIKIVIPLEACF